MASETLREADHVKQKSLRNPSTNFIGTVEAVVRRFS